MKKLLFFAFVLYSSILSSFAQLGAKSPLSSPSSIYTIDLWSAGAYNLVAANVYYVGMHPNLALDQTFTNVMYQIPKSGTITRIQYWVNTGGTLGTTEKGTLSLIYSNVVASTFTHFGSNDISYDRLNTNSANITVSQPVNVGDFIALKISSAASWVTAPTTVRYRAIVVIQ
jgi:hypothetical protein